MWLIFSAYVLIQCFKYLLDRLNVRHMEEHGGTVPLEFEGVVDTTVLRKSRNYLIDQTKLGTVESAFTSLAVLIFFFGGLLDTYGSWIAGLHLPFLMTGWIFFILLSLAEQVLAIPFNLFSVFKLERRYGFATTTAKLWVLDLVKEVLISSLILSFITCAGLWLISRSPRPITCSGRISALAVNGRSPRTTLTFRTSQPSRSIMTLTIALILLSALSMSRAASRALSRSFLVISPAASV